MTPDEIEADWERQTFGAPLKDKDTANKDEADYVKFLNDFIMGRSAFDHVTPKPRANATISNALRTLGLPPTATMREVGAKYRQLAKKYHPDTGGTANATEFTKVNSAYQTLKKHFGKK